MTKIATFFLGTLTIAVSNIAIAGDWTTAFNFTNETAPIGIIRKAGGEPICTASLIDKNMILTARHCLEKLGYGTQNEFVAGFNGSEGFASSRFSGTAWWGSGGNYVREDWAIVRLKENIGDRVGWFGISDTPIAF